MLQRTHRHHPHPIRLSAELSQRRRTEFNTAEIRKTETLIWWNSLICHKWGYTEHRLASVVQCVGQYWLTRRTTTFTKCFIIRIKIIVKYLLSQIRVCEIGNFTALADLRGAPGTCAPWVQILSFSCSEQKNKLAYTLGVGALFRKNP